MSFPKRGISIDIGNEKIKIVEYYKKKEDFKANTALLLDTPENSVKDGQITDVEVVAGVISEGLKENKIKSKSVVYTISSSKIITREVDLPDLPKKKLDTLIKMNAEEYFPVNLAEYTLDYLVTGKVENSAESMVRVNIIAAMTMVLESYVELTDALKLKIAGIDYSGNSIINFAKHVKEERTYMLLDLGSDSTMVTIMNQGVARFNRNLVYGTKVISNSIQNHFGVEYKEATKISTEQSLLTNTPEGNDYLSSDVSSALNQILNGVSRLVDYYSSRNKEGIDRIILVGGGTNIKGIDEYIENYFNIKTKIFGTEETESFGNEFFDKNAVFYANTIGAIYSDINLLPASILSKGKDKAAARLRLELGILLVALTAVIIYIPYSSIQKLEDEKEILMKEKAAKEVVIPIKEEHVQVMKDLAINENAVNESSSITQVIVQILEEMEEEMPSGINYLTMNSTEDGMVISCIASEKLELVSFITILKELTIDDQKVFSKVYVPSFAEVETTEAQEETNNDSNEGSDDSYYSFSVSCDFATEVE